MAIPDTGFTLIMDSERRNLRAPAAGVVAGLNDLLRLDHDSIAAYQIAIEALHDRERAQRITDFRTDHERHVRALNRLIVELGGEPVNEPHATGPLKEALQSLGARGGDRGILLAFRANESRARARYRRAAAAAQDWPAGVRRVIEQNALDEERHFRWVTDVLDEMAGAGGAGPDADAGRRVREVMARLDEVAGTVRARAADGLESAAQRLDRLAAEQEAAGGGLARAAGVAHRLAGGMEATAGLLRSGGGEMDLQGSIEAQARARPLQAVLVTFALGFVVGRILR